MPANSALSGANLTNLLLSATNGHTCPVYLTYWPDRTVATAEVDTTPTTFSVTELATTNESADWSTKVRAGQRVKITDSGGTTLRGYYQVRKSNPSTGILEIAEIANADPGLVALNSRTAGITAGDLITVQEHYDLRAMKPFTTLAGVTGQDYDIAVGTYNSLPESIFNATVNGQNGADFACLVANGATKAMTLVVTETDWPTDTGSVTYSWTGTTGWTGLSGTTSATLTGNAPVGAHVVYCTITNATDSWQVLKIFFVRIHSPADPPLEVLIGQITDTENRQWRTKTVRVASGAASVIPPGAFCMVWEDPTWNGADITSATKKVVGYRTGADWLHRPGYHESEVIITGVCGMLDMIASTAATLRFTGVTTTWEELHTLLQNVAFAIRWVLRWRCKNVLERFNFTPFDDTGSHARRSIITAPQGSVFQQIARLGEMYDVNVGSRSDGEIICAFHPSMMHDRTSVVTRVTVDNTHYSSITVNQREQPDCGVMRYEGVFTIDIRSDIPAGAQAPGERQAGQSAKTVTKTDKVFDNPTDATRRCGRAFAMETQPITSVMLEFPSNWDIFAMADMQRVVVQVPAARSPTGSALSLTCIPNTLTKYYIGGTKVKIQLTLEVETDGVEARYLDIRPSDTTAYGNNSDLQENPLSDVPADWGLDGDEVPVSGDLTGLLTAARDGYVSFNGEDISPASDLRTAIVPVIKMIVDPHNYRRLILYGEQGALVCDDMTNPAWRRISITSAIVSNTWSHSIDFTLTDADGVPGTDPQLRAVYVAGQGWHKSPDRNDRITFIIPLPSSAVVTSVTFTLSSCTLVSSVGIFIDGGIFEYVACSGGQATDTYAELTTANVGIDVVMDSSVDPYVTGLTINGTGTNPYGGGQPPSGETFIGDIVGTPNREGYFGWLALRNDTDVYYSYTSNYFRTIRTTSLGAYASDLTFGIAIASHGQGVVMVGGPGSAIWRSTNWGSTFGTIAALNPHGGAIDISFSRAGGSANVAALPAYWYFKGTAAGGTAQIVNMAGGTVALGTAQWPYESGGRQLHSFTTNGNYLMVAMQQGQVWRSTDAGATFGTTTDLGGTAWQLAGSPQNSGFMLAAGPTTLKYTANFGTAWTDLFSEYDTELGQDEFSGGGQDIVSAQIDLQALYRDEVTT